jgi:YegS/Rv2252/BmrU family lipid kinase
LRNKIHVNGHEARDGTVAILNPHAGRGRVARDRAEIERVVNDRFSPAAWLYTTRAGEATELAARAVIDGAARLVAVGGDGLVNEIVNGLFTDENASNRPLFSILPVGSGNDFVKSIGYDGVWPTPPPPLEDTPCDVGRVRLTDAEGASIARYFLNVSSGGASAVIADHANRVPGILPARLRYRVATVRGLLTFRNPRIRIIADADLPTEETVSMVCVANGTTFGAGMQVAPGARLDDGKLRLVVVGDVGLVAFARHGGELDRGEHVDLPFVKSQAVSTVSFETVDPNVTVWVETDGERAGRLPARYDVLPSALTVGTRSRRSTGDRRDAHHT